MAKAMKYLKVIGLAASMICLALPAALANCDPGEIVIKFSHVVAETGHPKGDAATLLAARVNDEMNGKACMQVFANSTLFNDDKVMSALLLGDVQLAAPSLAKFEAFTFKYRLFDLPFLFANLEAVERFTNSKTGRDLLHVTQPIGLTGLGYWSSGLKQFSANAALLTPSDAAGLRFRIQTSNVAEAMIEAMDGLAQKLAFSEVYGALENGTVDGQENTWSNIYTQKFFEVQNGITETNHQLLAYLLVTSSDWLAGLEPETRTQFLSIVEQVTATSNATVADMEAINRQNVLDAGGTIRQLSETERQQWVNTMRPVWSQFEADIGKEVIKAAVAANI